MKFKAIFCWLLIFILKVGHGQIQTCNNEFIRIDGKKFKCGLSDFFAVVCNYQTQVYHQSNVTSSSPPTFPNHFVTRAMDCTPSGNSQNSQISTQAQAYQLMLNDFNNIRSLGFNTIRVGPVSYGRAYPGYGFCPGFVPTGPISANPAIGSFDLGGYVNNYIAIDITNNSQLLLDITENVLQAAAAANLKVILLVSNPSNVVPWCPQATWNCNGTQTDSPPLPIVTDGFVNYLGLLAQKFKYNPTLIAIDFVNEPDLVAGGAKKDICALTKRWNDAVKSNSQILTTIGLWDVGSTYAWDPDICNIDFVSLHLYPVIRDKSNISDLQLSIEGLKAKYWWYNNYLRIPWMIGETAVTAHPMNTTHPINFHIDLDASPFPGTLTDQADYLEATIKSCRDYGGIGYSWWAHMDDGVGNPAYSVLGGKNYWGLVYANEPNQTYSTKPAAAKVGAFWSTSIDPPIGSPPYQYYTNPEHFPIGGNHSSGIVLDENSSPIAGALISVYHNDGTGVKLVGETFSDISGAFSMELTPTSGYFEYKITGFGDSIISANGFPTADQVYHLHQIRSRPLIPTSKTYQSQNLYNANVNDYVSNNADFSNNYNVFTGNFNITAGSVVHLNNGFSAKYGSNFKARIGKYYDDCSTFYFRPANEDVGIKEIQQEKYFNIYPNPGNGKYLFLSSLEDNYKINIYNIQGSLMRTCSFSGKSQEINIEDLAPGIYFFNIKSNNSTPAVVKVIKE
jgi:hypothetical protein